MSDESKRGKQNDPAARLRAEQMLAENEQSKERKNYLALTIYAMALLFAVSLNFLWLQDLWFGLIAMASQLFSGLLDTTGWVTWWKGALSVVIICGFFVSAGAARFLAGQK